MKNLFLRLLSLNATTVASMCLNSEARPQNLHGKMGGTKPTHSVYAVRELVWGVPTSNCLEGGRTWGVPSVFGWDDVRVGVSKRFLMQVRNIRTAVRNIRTNLSDLFGGTSRSLADRSRWSGWVPRYVMYPFFLY